ncbi:Non-hemolytic phospholipase C precursor (PLC-N) (Phosphatidylcholine cholinephosphohydrolase) (Phosphatidylcholine-hydrolyzing phospholipase C) (PC-PLC) [Bradyrhizobium sp. STM 3843]|uniref:phosphocholine-specific phospholipase C n=1 Tax=Bradyrhizobium sp. STM 3843 TaxID=551947 RepID=UPI0002403609|nr:phospholipase C, phosphocholine-specific [Bradyrhizobium sp. STM 3843]CCE12027.1 Non-hemolytic phospholipase C precursor (PLC-N) (Phosphatidylcholine cholinephosphohydrolase) (Phosphatidylcholine-hydrolyzing phospholipase C) (PC-PLC) [Bradyrhizobium sp. STM 3843]
MSNDMRHDRREFLRLLGASAATAALTQSIERAHAIPAFNRQGTIEDVKHIVVLMQENRAFDHYFGSMRGVRGFNDPRAVKLPNGNPVWQQPNGNTSVMPFRVDNAANVYVEDVAHGWNDGQKAWNNGKYDQWIPNKGTTTMTHMNRQDLTWHYALADAFTVCDAYFCSVMGPTDPNRYYMWTGWDGNDGKNGGPVITNAEAGYDWSTFPELLEKAGISWKIYQDIGTGLTADGSWGWTSNPWIGNFGDNSLLYFHQYQNSQPGSPLYEKALRGTNIAKGGSFENLFDLLRNDVRNGTLPQVSWIAAPEAFSEHPNWLPGPGAWYISKVLDILTSNPELWSKTVLLINYDEGGGFFDHVVGPYPAPSKAYGQSTVDTSTDLFAGDGSHVAGPYGLGVRVPMLVVSPWSRGGFVCSEVFDHTSVIRFIEKRFHRTAPGLFEKNVPAWRRAVCGDLTSAFNFRSPNEGLAPLPPTVAPPASDITSGIRYDNYHPVPPAQPAMPVQEQGVRPARPLPYNLSVDGSADPAQKRFAIRFANPGDAGVCFHVRSGNSMLGPWSYTVESEKSLNDVWDLAATAGQYDLSVYGPNGFFRGFKGGGIAANVANVDISSMDFSNEGSGNDVYGLGLVMTNKGAICTVTLVDNYTGQSQKHRLRHGETFQTMIHVQHNQGWYDLAVTADTDPGFKWQLAGHVENGCATTSDPAMGKIAST